MFTYGRNVCYTCTLYKSQIIYRNETEYKKKGKYKLQREKWAIFRTYNSMLLLCTIKLNIDAT